MWSFVLVVYLFAATSFASIPDFVPQEVREFSKKLHNKCVKENGLTDDDIDSYELSNKSPAMMCYMKCLMLESGWMSNDFKLQYEKIGAMPLGPLQEQFLSTVNKCRDIPEGSDECERAYNFNVCWERVGKDHYFLP